MLVDRAIILLQPNAMIAEISISNELVRGLFTVGAVWLGAWLGLRSHKANKWWETKQKAYEEVIGLLEECRTLNRTAAILHDQADGSQIDLEASERYEKKLTELAVTEGKLRSLKNRSTFMMSDRTQDVLRRLWISLEDCRIYDGAVRRGEEAGSYKIALDEFVYAARHDLKVARYTVRLKHSLRLFKQAICPHSTALKNGAHYCFWWGWRGEAYADRACKR